MLVSAAKLSLLKKSGSFPSISNETQHVVLDENQQFRSDLIPGVSIRIGELLDRL